MSGSTSSRAATFLSQLTTPFRGLRSIVERWLFQFGNPLTATIVLVQRRIFILPSRYGLLFMCAVLMMLTGSINYNLSLGFILTFLLASLGVSAILHTFRNLARLKISPGKVTPVFAGDVARFTLLIDNPTYLERYSIGVTLHRRESVYIDVPGRQSISVGVPLVTTRRGVLPAGRFTVFTQFPLGLCYAWAYADFDVECLVYPRPEAGRVPLPLADSNDGGGVTRGAGQEDFAGLRSYQPGDSPRHIAWKAAARGETLLTKQFSGRADLELWLDWRHTPEHMGVEERLSRLARWVIDAHGSTLNFGLRLPGLTLAAASGHAQRERCLEALALFKAETQ